MENKPKKTVLKNKVKLFKNENFIGNQKVIIEEDKDEGQPWVLIEHNNEALSLSFENIENLIKLYNDAKKQFFKDENNA